MKHIPNAITAVRICSAILMLFSPPLSAPFFVLYTLGGVSDMIDGTVARRLGTAGGFGARLDSIADLLFFLSAAVKLLPALRSLLPLFSLYAAAVIVLVKLMSLIIGWLRLHKPFFLHSFMNKLTGAAVFLLPFLYRTGCFSALVCAVCVIAILAAVHEFFCALKLKELPS